MIEASALGKTYGSFPALRGVDLRVERGEVFGLLGPNGAGKSTMTKIFCGLVRPTAGAATVAGLDVTKHPREVKRLIGYLPERVPVYKSMTAREYLRLFARLQGIPRARRDAIIEQRLESVNLTGVEGRRVGGFSKGMTQRLGIARALLHDPQVVFFDEPASGLDPTGRREIRTLLQMLGQSGTTVFLCSHDLAEVQATCRRIGFIRKGELVKVQKVGETHLDRREFKVELDGDAARIAPLVQVSGAFAIEPQGSTLRIEAPLDVTRVDVARAIVKAGGLHLSIAETAASLETLYREYIETPAQEAVA